MENSKDQIQAFDLQILCERMRTDSNALTIKMLEELEFVGEKNLKTLYNYNLD